MWSILNFATVTETSPMEFGIKTALDIADWILKIVPKMANPSEKRDFEMSSKQSEDWSVAL